MGKRKLHANTYFQCDWTGLPMRSTNCYMPDWNQGSGKLVKHGSYCCWEAVVAHAIEMLDHPDDVDADRKLDKIREHINGLVGCTVEPAPHHTQLAWFARDTDDQLITSPKDFMDKCTASEQPFVAVVWKPDGTSHEVVCNIKNFENYLSAPPLYDTGANSFQTVRKKGNKDRELCVFYYPFKNGLAFHTTASNLFKMQIYGDVLMVQQSKEPCFLPRERYVNYFLTMFEDEFCKKRKEPTTTLTTEDYATAKAQMASELQAVEGLASSSASLPSELAKAAVLPAPTGAELAALLQAQGRVPPKKKSRPAPPPAAYVEVAA